MSLVFPRAARLALACLFLLPAGATWQAVRVSELNRSKLQRLQSDLDAATIEKAALASRISELQTSLKAEDQPPNPTDSAGSAARDRSSQPNSMDPWSTPPETLPNWDPSSPYVWLPKESLDKLPIQPFGHRGSLDGHVGEIFGIEPASAQKLHAACEDILRRQESLESEHSAVSFPGASTHRMQLQMKLPPDVATELQSSFEETLRQHLGAGRTDLILKLGRSWIDEQFSASKSFSVTLLPDGKYEVSNAGAGVFRSFGGISSLDGVMPQHFAARFVAHFESLHPPPGSQSREGENKGPLRD